MKKQKGQELIEYALMLALVVGIGGFIYTQGYGANISGVFNNAGNLLEQVDKTQEEAKKEAARNADRSYADYLGELLKKAVANGTIKLSNGSSVYLLVQNEPNSKYSGTHMNAAKTGGTVWIKDKEYGKMPGLAVYWTLRAVTTVMLVFSRTACTGTACRLKKIPPEMDIPCPIWTVIRPATIAIKPALTLIRPIPLTRQNPGHPEEIFLKAASAAFLLALSLCFLSALPPLKK